MKVIIVGAGLSGLTTAIALHKYIHLPNNEQLKILIYDRADPKDIGEYGWHDHADLRQKNQGAAISLQPNALRVLRDLSAELADAVYHAGFPCTHFTWKTAGDWLLGREYIDLLPISRPKLVECLAGALPEGVEIQYKTISKVQPKADAETRATVSFDDGTTEDADLIVGADGIRSPVRHCLFGPDSKEAKAQYLGTSRRASVLNVEIVY